MSNGWVWRPDGAIDAWDLKRWFGENVWESEDGRSKVRLCWRGYFWDGPLCWTDDRTVAVWGYGKDDDWLIPAVRLFDVISGRETFWFAGPEAISRKTSDCLLDPSSSMVFGDYLFALSKEHGTGVWDVATGECLLQDGDIRPDRYHPGAKRFVTALSASSFRLSRLSRG